MRTWPAPSGPGPTRGLVIHHMPGWDESDQEIARKLPSRLCGHLSENLHFAKARHARGKQQQRPGQGGMPDDRSMAT